MIVKSSRVCKKELFASSSLSVGALSITTMADFDAIYEEEEEESEPHLEQHYHVTLVPDPIVIRGAGNMTVSVIFTFIKNFFHFSLFTHFCLFIFLFIFFICFFSVFTFCLFYFLIFLRGSLFTFLFVYFVCLRFNEYKKLNNNRR